MTLMESTRFVYGKWAPLAIGAMVLCVIGLLAVVAVIVSRL